MSTTTRDTTETVSISGVTVPNSTLAKEATDLVRDTESPLLFNHSTRVFYFAPLAVRRSQSHVSLKREALDVKRLTCANEFL
jgi:hypothetical protein